MKLDPNKYCVCYKENLGWALLHDMAAHWLMGLTLYKVQWVKDFHNYTSHKAWIRKKMIYKYWRDVPVDVKFKLKEDLGKLKSTQLPCFLTNLITSKNELIKYLTLDVIHKKHSIFIMSDYVNDPFEIDYKILINVNNKDSEINISSNEKIDCNRWELVE
jgi:hypothetical protein